MLNLKRDFLNKLAALKIINSESFSKLKNLNLNKSLINPQNDTFNFLIELIKILLGWEEIKKQTINFLSYHLFTIESTIKFLLKKILNTEFLCNTNPLIPDKYIDEGLYVALSQIDFFKILKVSPASSTGKFIYGSDSLDLNAFLYAAINSGDEENWKSILNVSYVSNNIVDGQNRTDVLLIKIDESYRNKPVLTFVNDFIDSIALFSLPLLINRIFDNLFGVFSLKIGKSFDQLKKEEEFNSIIEKIINTSDVLYEDSYFNFSKNEITLINKRARNTKNGIRIVNHCNSIIQTPNEDVLTNLNESLILASFNEINEILTDNFNILSESIVQNVPNKNKSNSLLEFYSSFFKGIIIGLVNVIFSPKTMLLFAIYFKIVNNTIGFIDLNDFLKKNRQLLIDLIKNTLLPILIRFLINIIVKEVKKLAIADQAKKREEQAKYYELQITSLLGIPQDINNFLSNL